MARQEQDREDLLREATALVERIELTLPAGQGTVVAGFRRDGSASFFFGSQRAVHFTIAGAVRRGFDHGLLLKADRGRLVVLHRRRTASAVLLESTELDSQSADQWLGEMGERLDALSAALQAGQVEVVGQVPADVDVCGRLATWLATWLADHSGAVRIAARPHAGGP